MGCIWRLRVVSWANNNVLAHICVVGRGKWWFVSHTPEINLTEWKLEPCFEPVHIYDGFPAAKPSVNSHDVLSLSTTNENESTKVLNPRRSLASQTLA